MEDNATPIRSGDTKSGRRRRPNLSPGNPDEKNESNFDSEHDEAEINPEKLEREKINPDRSGDDNSKGHEPYEFKKQDHAPARGESGKKDEQHGSLMGQGGYGTSEDRPDGSTGYNSGYLGYKPKYKEIDINKLGKNLH